jgi:hypothetical protein
MALVDAALALGIPFRAVVADCIYGESEAFEGPLWEAGLPYVVALKPSRGTWAPEEEPHTPQEAAQRLCWNGTDDPQDWTPVVRRFRDGHTETWWAAELTLGGCGPDRSTRLVVATSDPTTLPEETTWYLATNLPRPGSTRAAEWPAPPADLEEIVRLYGLRNWVEQSYKQAKHQLGWADFQVRKDPAIRRHWEMVCCAFAFCWWVRFRCPDEARLARDERQPAVIREPCGEGAEARSAVATAQAGEKSRGRRASRTAPRRGGRRGGEGIVAQGTAPGPGMAGPLEFCLALLAGVERSAPATTTPGLARYCG